MAEIKTKLTKVSVKEFLGKVKPAEKSKDCLELVKIFESVTKEKAKMWGTAIVGFGFFHYKSERSAQEGDWFYTGFSPRAANITLYVGASSPAHKENLKSLGKYKVSGSCLHIKQLSDVSIPVLKKIIATSVQETKKRYNVK